MLGYLLSYLNEVVRIGILSGFYHCGSRPGQYRWAVREQVLQEVIIP